MNWIVAAAIVGGFTLTGVGLFYLMRRLMARRDSRRMSQALTITHEIFENLDKVPNTLINRELRKGLVLLIKHHVDVLMCWKPCNPDTSTSCT